MRTTSEEKQEKIIGLYIKGYKITDIAQKVGITRQTIRAILLRRGYLESAGEMKFYNKPKVCIGDIIKIKNDGVCHEAEIIGGEKYA